MSENSMPTPVNHAAIGKLVKSWVLERDRLMIPDPENTKQNLTWQKPVSTKDPAAIAALRQQFLAAGTHFTIPSRVNELVVVESSDTCFVLKLPSAQAILASEERLKTAMWVVPDIYTDANNIPSPTIEQKLNFDNQRIGDYTIANCAG